MLARLRCRRGTEARQRDDENRTRYQNHQTAKVDEKHRAKIPGSARSVMGTARASTCVVLRSHHPAKQEKLTLTSEGREQEIPQLDEVVGADEVHPGGLQQPPRVRPVRRVPKTDPPTLRVGLHDEFF